MRLRWPEVRTCSLALVVAACSLPARADDWPQWLGPKRDGIWRETGVVQRFPQGGPKVRWRTPIGGGYAGPAVANGRVYITDRVLAAGARNPMNPFARDEVPGKERVLCLDEATGKVLWTHEYDCRYQIAYPAGPRTTPSVDGDRVYTLGAMGDLLCLKTADGKVAWSKNVREEYSAPTQMWGFSAHPLIDGDKLICLIGGRGSVVVAFDKHTGKELWRSLTAQEQGYCPPVIYDFAGKRQLIIWHPSAVVALNPETGEEYWSQRFPIKAALSIPMPRLAGDQLFVSSFYNGSLMLKLDRDKPGASVVWKSNARGERPDQTTDLSSIMPTPFLRDGYIYGVCSYGELRCLKAETGERVWESLQATGSMKGDGDRWANVFLVPQGEQAERFFLFNEKGDLIIARLTPKGYEEIDRAHLLEPTNRAMQRKVLWSHPAFANKCIYARNDKEIVCVSLAAQ